MKEFLIPTNKGKKRVLEKNILRIEANSNYCKVYFIDEQPLLVAKVLHWFEANLTRETFCRIHRTHLVNMDHVVCFYGCRGLSLSNGDIVKPSRRKKMMLEKMFSKTA